MCIRISIHDNIVGTWTVNKINDELVVDNKPWLFASNGFMKPTYQMEHMVPFGKFSIVFLLLSMIFVPITCLISTL
jgi:hypothetical protein